MTIGVCTQASRPQDDGADVQLPAPSPASEWLQRGRSCPPHRQPRSQPRPQSKLHSDQPDDSRDTGGGLSSVQDWSEPHAPDGDAVGMAPGLRFGDSASSLLNADGHLWLGKQLKLSLASSPPETEQNSMPGLRPQTQPWSSSHEASGCLQTGGGSTQDVLDFRESAQASARRAEGEADSSHMEHLCSPEVHVASRDGRGATQQTASGVAADHALQDESEGHTMAGQGPSVDHAASGPVFVPVVLRMNAKEHALLLEDWAGRQQVKRLAVALPIGCCWALLCPLAV
ncbi:hypothetical protein MMC29_003641 [Sticta canariensis]|nr:hypothetical protein [Sticta canariensis]